MTWSQESYSYSIKLQRVPEKFHLLFIYIFLPSFLLYKYEFAGGCQGNANRFATATFCEEACKRDNPQRPPQKIGPQGSLVDVCHLPADSGKSFSNLICMDIKMDRMRLIFCRALRRQSIELVFRFRIRRMHLVHLFRVSGQRQSVHFRGTMFAPMRTIQKPGKDHCPNLINI